MTPIMRSLALLVLLLPVMATAAEKTLRWDYTASGAAGFMLYCGPASATYSSRVDVGNTDTHTGLYADGWSFCAVTAYDPAQIESAFSNEVAFNVVSPPVVKFKKAPTVGPAPLSVVFDNNTKGAVDTWAWDFGDGATSSERDPTHVYTVKGKYVVVLTATGPGGTAQKVAGTKVRVQ